MSLSFEKSAASLKDKLHGLSEEQTKEVDELVSQYIRSIADGPRSYLSIPVGNRPGTGVSTNSPIKCPSCGDPINVYLTR